MEEYKFGNVDWASLEHEDGRPGISFSEAEDEGIIYRSHASLGEEFVALSPDDSPTTQAAVQVALIACDSAANGEGGRYHTSAEVFRELVNGWRFPQAAVASGPACCGFHDVVDAGETCCWYGLAWQDDADDRHWQRVFLCQITGDDPTGVRILFLCTKDLKPVISERLQDIFDQGSDDSAQMLLAKIHLLAAGEAARGLRLVEGRLATSVAGIVQSLCGDSGIEQALLAVEDAAECLDSVRLHTESLRQYSSAVTKLQRSVFFVDASRDAYLGWCNSVVSSLLQDVGVLLIKNDSRLHGLRDYMQAAIAKITVHQTLHDKPNSIGAAQPRSRTRQSSAAANRYKSVNHEDATESSFVGTMFVVLMYVLSFGVGLVSAVVSLIMFFEDGQARSDGTYLKLASISLTAFIITWSIVKKSLG